MPSSSPSLFSHAEETVTNAAVTGLIDGGQDPPFPLVSSTGVADELGDVRTSSGMPINQLYNSEAQTPFPHDMPKRVDAFETLPTFWSGLHPFLHHLAQSEFTEAQHCMKEHIVNVANSLLTLHSNLLQRGNEQISKTYLLEMRRCLIVILHNEQRFQEAQLCTPEELKELKKSFEEQKLRMCKHEGFAWDLQNDWESNIEPSIVHAIRTDASLQGENDTDWTVHTLHNSSKLSRHCFTDFTEEDSRRIIQCNFQHAQRIATKKGIENMLKLVTILKHLFELREWTLELYIMLATGPSTISNSRRKGGRVHRGYSASSKKRDGANESIHSSRTLRHSEAWSTEEVASIRVNQFHFYDVELLRCTERILNHHQHLFSGKNVDVFDTCHVSELAQPSLRQVSIIQNCLLARICAAACNLSPAIVYLERAKSLIRQWHQCIGFPNDEQSGRQRGRSLTNLTATTSRGSNAQRNGKASSSLDTRNSKLSIEPGNLKRNSSKGSQLMRRVASLMCMNVHATITLYFFRTLQHSQNMMKNIPGSLASNTSNSVLHRFRHTPFDYQKLFKSLVDERNAKLNYTERKMPFGKARPIAAEAETKVIAFLMVDYVKLRKYRDLITKLVYSPHGVSQPPHERHKPAIVTPLGIDMNSFDFNQFDVVEPHPDTCQVVDETGTDHAPSNMATSPPKSPLNSPLQRSSFDTEDVEDIDDHVYEPRGVDRWRVLYSYPDHRADTSNMLFRNWPSLVSLMLDKSDELDALNSSTLFYTDRHLSTGYISSYYISDIDSAISLVVMFQCPELRNKVDSVDNSIVEFANKVRAVTNHTQLFSRDSLCKLVSQQQNTAPLTPASATRSTSPHSTVES